MVAAFGESTGHCALEALHKKMRANPIGERILEEKPRINCNTIDIDKLSKMPVNTFGFTYYSFLKDNVSQYWKQDDAELAYVMQRYREIHDMIHALLGMSAAAGDEFPMLLWALILVVFWYLSLTRMFRDTQSSKLMNN